MTYRIEKVMYQLIPRFDISSMPGTLPIVYSVPVISHLLPNASPAAFTAFANCKVGRMRDTYRGSFVPRAYSDTA